jgi:hypothetical protein
VEDAAGQVVGQAAMRKTGGRAGGGVEGESRCSKVEGGHRSERECKESTKEKEMR